MGMHEVEGYDEIIRKLVSSVPPEQVLAAYTPEQIVPALPDEILRALSDEYLATLPRSARAAVRARIGR